MGKIADALEKAAPENDFARIAPKQAGASADRSAAKPPERRDQDPFAGGDWDERLRLASDKFSPFAENFRRLRGTILHPPTGAAPKTILVTSLMPGEGKGFVCANLGISLAREMEHHALLVDCDFRRPSLAGLFGIGNEVGLVDHLRDGVDLAPLIRQTGQSKLTLLPSGRPPANPAELLTSRRILPFIDELAARYDDRIILFDSPPGLVASETSILAKRLDGVILVVRQGRAGKELVKKFADELGADKIIGVVFNAYEENKVDSLLYGGAGYGPGAGYY